MTIGGFGSPPGLRLLPAPPQARPHRGPVGERLKLWGLPLHCYRFTVEALQRPSCQDRHGTWQRLVAGHPGAGRVHPPQDRGGKIIITEIWIDDDGTTLQTGTQYGDLTL